MSRLDGSLNTSNWANLLEGVDEPVHEDLHTKEHQKRPEEEVRQVVDDGDGQQEQPKFNTCSKALPSSIPLLSRMVPIPVPFLSYLLESRARGPPDKVRGPLSSPARHWT